MVRTAKKAHKKAAERNQKLSELEEEKLMAARLDKMLSTEDNLNNQIKLLVSKLNEVKEEGEKAESYMTRQIETLKNEKFSFH